MTQMQSFWLFELVTSDRRRSVSLGNHKCICGITQTVVVGLNNGRKAPGTESETPSTTAAHEDNLQGYPIYSGLTGFGDEE